MLPCNYQYILQDEPQSSFAVSVPGGTNPVQQNRISGGISGGNRVGPPTLGGTAGESKVFCTFTLSKYPRLGSNQ